MRVLIADDHPMVRDALALSLAGFAPGVLVSLASDYAGLMAQADGGRFDLALVDLGMPGADGLAGLRQLRTRHPGLPVIVVSGQADAGTARAALEAGASGFVPKTESAEILRQALHTVLAGRVFMPPYAVQALQVAALGVPAPPELTPRQRDVLGLLQQGAPNKVIAQQLGLSEGTVKLHIAALLRALGARNRTEAIVRARDMGLELGTPVA